MVGVFECAVFFLGEFKVPSKPAAVDGRAATFGVLELVRAARCGTEAACRREREREQTRGEGHVASLTPNLVP